MFAQESSIKLNFDGNKMTSMQTKFKHFPLSNLNLNHGFSSRFTIFTLCNSFERFFGKWKLRTETPVECDDMI